MRLIDADKRIARYCEENCGCTRQECTLTYEHDGCEACTFVQEIEDEPSVDAEPVRHGRWVKSGYACGESEWTCTVCGNKEWRVSSGRLKWCPFCGAKMDGGADNER